MGDQRNLFQKIFGLGQRPVTQAPPSTGCRAATTADQSRSHAAIPGAEPARRSGSGRKKKKKPGFWGRLFGKKDDSQQQPQSAPQ